MIRINWNYDICLIRQDATWDHESSKRCCSSFCRKSLYGRHSDFRHFVHVSSAVCLILNVNVLIQLRSVHLGTTCSATVPNGSHMLHEATGPAGCGSEGQKLPRVSDQTSWEGFSEKVVKLFKKKCARAFSESTDVRSRPLNFLKVCTAFFEQAISEINHLTTNLGKKSSSPQEIPADVKPPCCNDSIIRLHPYVLQITSATHGDELRVNFNSFGLQEPRLRILPRVVAQADVDLK